MTYRPNVFGGTLNLALSIYRDSQYSTISYIDNKKQKRLQNVF